jgi:hypothetical protein
MNGEENEKVLDLLCDKFIYGLSEEEARQLEELGYDTSEAESIELTIAMLSMADLDAEEQMPAALQQKLEASAAQFSAQMAPAALAEPDEAPVPQREIVLSGGGGSSWFGWLGWATAAAASVALAVTLFMPRGGDNRAGVSTPPPTPIQEERSNPAQERERLIESAQQLVRAEWAKGNVKEVEVAGDVVWSDEKQTGYMRFRGLPKNDPGKETYQLWIFDETQSEKTPIDGGVFDVSADGEVIVPIDPKLKAKNPKAFAVTVEKPGGVVVSDRKRIVALGAVKPSQV